MAQRWLQMLAAACLLGAPGSAVAVSFGAGIEIGGATSYLVSSQSSPNIGLILTQRFDLRPADLTLWEDATLPVIYEGSPAGVPAEAFMLVGLGLRAGLPVLVGLPGPVFRPYVGFLVNDSISFGTSKTENSNVPGLGGDVGLELAASLVCFGLELRAYETLIPPVSGGELGEAFALQVLLSIRIEL